MKNIVILKITSLLLSSFLFLSCLDVETIINVSDDKSGVWILKYRIMQEASFLTPGEELKGYNYFPASEAEIIDRIDGIGGLDLISVTLLKTIVFTEFVVEMNFKNTNDIQIFFNTYTDNALFNIGFPNEGVFEFVLNNPFPGGNNTDTLNLIFGLYSKNTVNITIILPGIVKESNQGFLSEDPAEANLSLTIDEIFNISESIEWIVQYE